MAERIFTLDIREIGRDCTFYRRNVLEGLGNELSTVRWRHDLRIRRPDIPRQAASTFNGKHVQEHVFSSARSTDSNLSTGLLGNVSALVVAADLDSIV